MDERYFIGDWGTTHLRLYLMNGGKVVDVRLGAGISAVQSPATALTALVGEWIDSVPLNGPFVVTLCGMASSRNGLCELPYVTSPASLESWGRASRHIQIETLQVLLATGVRCGNNEAGFDVMRGEEAQVFGAMRLNPALSEGRHLLVLPGTHSKWVEVAQGSITDIRTSLTGELYTLLRDHSTLLKAGSNTGHGHDEAQVDAGFIAGAEHALRVKEGLLSALFKTRTAQLLQNHSSEWAAGFLSGLLIGHEISTLDGETSREPVTIIGDPKLTALYQCVFSMRDRSTQMFDGATCVIAGMQQLREMCRDSARSAT